ncbi:MAG: hypothetical protein O4861_19840 [Trichodesmium sp. St16_bin4-tuft]|nr:hypothetical protein [Trichodesmium sp. MAG_R01]MDE5068973.1 hypothetical protein [Trichodesmium sp. St4_bin8_1]MDE5072431.1 hypothetical protein [Trichodesmium sp. St5_bin8]MDE5077861.1 hypothetical protein [Trichodesmium sp. St2_bin6]MDE5100456.1 hypothetical protein [Trichodesmium sp. St16_bin4-tuft]MDE5104095.1 hypothetical protein [Trichodesmium sp. St19_bin2]
MILSRDARRLLAPILLCLLLFTSACGGAKQPSRFDQAQQQSKTERPSKAKQVSGGSLNKYFPSSSGEYKLNYAQEKKGFAQASLKKDDKEVAVMSINDISASSTAAKKFQDSSQKIGGYPAVEQGTKTTAVLVDNRFQVKAQSKDPSFTANDREAWLKKFNLSGLASLK